MKRNTMIALGAVGILVLFVVMMIDDGAFDQSTINNSENTGGEFSAEKQENDEDNQEISAPVFSSKQECKGNARCISGFVTRIVDGDTITVDGQSVRFAIVNTPEYGENDYSQAKNYIENICPVGSQVLVDEDDKQTGGSHGRIIGVIYCNDLNLSQEILEAGHAKVLPSICKKSEFANEDWAQKFGC